MATRVIEDGSVIIIQRFQYMRTFSLNLSKNPNVQLGNDCVNLTSIKGLPYGTAFKMKHVQKKQWDLEVTEEIPDFEEEFLEDESNKEEEEDQTRKDNRDLKDENSSQKLSRDQIEEMKAAGKESKEIIGQLIANSETFQKKTKFSQAKFLKKKARKYHEYIVIREPSLRILMQIYYKKDPIKIMNLRIDSLAQMINQTNLRSGSKVLVYEVGCQGIVVAGALERVGTNGKVVHIYQTGNPQNAAVGSMNFSPEVSENLSTLNMYHLRSLEQGEDITAMHQSKPGAEGENSEIKRDTNGKVPFRQRLREDSVKSHSLLTSGAGMDALIIACKQHPTNLLLSLIKYLAPSRPFAVFSPYKEPLLHAYMAVKDTKRALMVTLSESWLRSHQILPERSHPEVLMSGGGGYILSGIYVDDSSEGITDCSATQDQNGGGKRKRFRR